MHYLKKLRGIALILCFISSCSSPSQKAWTYLVPPQTSFIVIPSNDATLQSALQSPYSTLLGDISSSSLQLMTAIDSLANQSLQLESIFLYPGVDQKLQPIWVVQPTDQLKNKLTQKYKQRFRQNSYNFQGIPISNLKMEQRNIFAARFSGLLFLSESSLGIEQIIRVYRGQQAAADLSAVALKPGTVVLNTPSLDHWIRQFARVSYHPAIQNIFRGTKAGIMQTTADSNTIGNYQLEGTIPLADKPPTSLLTAISQPQQPITLDTYISSNAAAFGIFHQPITTELPETLSDTSKTDTYLLENEDTYAQLAQTLDTELALVLFTQSGFLSEGEHLYIRKVQDTTAIGNQLNTLVEKGLARKDEGIFSTQSTLIAQLLGSPLCNFESFYIKLTDQAVILSERRGLTQMIASDRKRKRVMSYNVAYQQIKKGIPDEVSSLFVTGPEFYSFLEPFLQANNYADLLISTFDYSALVTQKQESEEQLSFSFSTHEVESGNQPYRENWVYPLEDTQLSGKPIFGNLGGSAQDEVIFATRSGEVYALAADGTVVQELSTGNDQPVGSPVVHDWYGTGQNVILIAAGNKVYGWNENGELLPQFPFTLNETITAPLTIADVDGDGMPNAIVATANRQIHILNGRGVNINGWPITTHASIQSAPKVDTYRNTFSIIAFAGNAVYGWNANGQRLNNFPVFINASFNGAPLIYDDHILGGAADGHLYAIGPNPLFSAALDSYRSGSTSNVESISVSNRPLVGSPGIGQEESNSGQAKIVTTSSNGAIFLLNMDGKLLLTQNMGQPSAQEWSPIITDINNNGSSDVVALADYGRLYAWEIKDGERILDLPTAGMTHLSIRDVNGDGRKEIVAQTSEGVHCWTIF